MTGCGGIPTAGPVGWAIFAGQLGQLEIEYLSRKNIAELEREGTEKLIGMLRRYRDRIIRQMREIEVTKIGMSGLIPARLFKRKDSNE